MSLSLRKSFLGLTALLTPAMAIASEVNVYSYRQPELVAPLFDAFTAETGIKVNVAFLKKGMVEKLQAEGARSPADVVLTVDISRLNSIVEAGVTQPVVSDIINATIPADFRDPEGNWFGITTRARIVYASKDRVADGEVTTYEDLADPKWKGRVCIRSGTNAYNLALTSAVIANHGEEVAGSWLTGLKSNLARKPQGNDRAQVKAIYAGECDIAVGNTYYMKQMLSDPDQVAWADSVRIVFPTFENGGTHVNLSGIAMTKHAPNRDNALALMEFLVGDVAQGIYASANGEYPLNAAVSADPLVASWGTFTADDTPLVDIAKLRGAALKLTEISGFDE
jgi:iron(III) transport system substrate-binding protein